MIFESHAHFDDKAFDEDRDILLSYMREKGIEYIINVTAEYDSIEATYELTKKYDFVYGTVGIHPSDITELNLDKFEIMKKKATRDKIVAIGEIGLDYYWDKEETVQQKQREWFVKQLEMAKEVKKPIIVHSREAAADTLNILKSDVAKDIPGVIHCYSYSLEQAKIYAKMGYYFGIGGVVTFSNAKKLVETVEYLPLEQILLETDSPYLAPVPNRGKRNSSLNLPYIAEKIAQIKNVSYDTVVEVTAENAKRLFFGI